MLVFHASRTPNKTANNKYVADSTRVQTKYVARFEAIASNKERFHCERSLSLQTLAHCKPSPRAALTTTLLVLVLSHSRHKHRYRQWSSIPVTAHYVKAVTQGTCIFGAFVEFSIKKRCNFVFQQKLHDFYYTVCILLIAGNMP